VTDRRAERTLRCAFGIDVDPLVVAGRGRERVDPLLADLDPRRGAEFSARRERIRQR
jgi:hypothetical protein